MNNAAIKNAATCGILGAMDMNPLYEGDTSDYARIHSVIAAFSTAIDDAILPDAGIGQAQADMMQSICGNTFIGRVLNADIASYEIEQTVTMIVSVYNGMKNILV